MRKISDIQKPADINGMFLAVYKDGQPVLFTIEDIDFLPIFSTTEKCFAAINLAGVEPEEANIKVIDDRAMFLMSTMGKVRVMIDPWITDQGNTRFVELKFRSAGDGDDSVIDADTDADAENPEENKITTTNGDY